MFKTTLVFNMMVKEVMQQIPAAYFSLDANEREIALKMISQSGNIPFSRLNKLSDNNVQNQVLNCILDLKDASFCVECNPLFKIHSLEERIKEHVIDGGVKIVYIDSLQLLAYNDERTDHDTFGEVCIQLKKLAIELNIPIVLLSGLNRQLENRIYPTDEQKVLFVKTFGCCRFVYNWALNLKITAYKKCRETLGYVYLTNLMKSELKAEHEWLSEVNSQSLQSALRNLDTAYTIFFRNTKIVGFPRFKSRRDRQGFLCPQHCRVNFEKGTILVDTAIREIPVIPHTGDTAWGIDLGIKSLAVCSDGRTFDNPKNLQKKP